MRAQALTLHAKPSEKADGRSIDGNLSFSQDTSVVQLLLRDSTLGHVRHTWCGQSDT